MTAYRLDVPEFHARLDTERRKQGLTWRAVGRATGLPVSIFTRISKGRSLEADAMVTLLVWLGLDTDIAYLIKPAAESIDCPGCGRSYRPNREGQIRKHDCQPPTP
jgi:hypothetical protein